MTTKKPTSKKPTNKKAPTKPTAKKPAAKKVVEKQSNPETVRITIDTHEAGHTHAPVSTGVSSAAKPKKKSFWKRIFGFGF